MIRVYPAESRYVADRGWLMSSASFSFGEYFDPANTAFSVMRVMNDDIVQGGKGFGPHPHSDMEIVSVVLEGAIKHQDSLGNTVVTKAGGIQRMTAGSGVVHAEYNASDTEPMRILQLWFMTDERGHEPSFETCAYPEEKLSHGLLPVVTPVGGVGQVSIHQDLTLYLSRLRPESELIHHHQPDRSAYLFIIEGELAVNGKELKEGDAARITEIPELSIVSRTDSFFMLIDLPRGFEMQDHISSRASSTGTTNPTDAPSRASSAGSTNPTSSISPVGQSSTAASEKLLIKHAVGGRTFLDSSKNPSIRYKVEPEGEGWLFLVEGAPSEAIEQIVEWREELNVFIFRDDLDRPTEKCWYYVQNGPVHDDQPSGQLTIHAKSRIEYIPDEF
ncbi:pirin family protein [Gorillibacterium timonense]|uniref:pirin family protein n=1 Tax=Gorillibacterium timonense TaxID=1689269 RepID=UPI0009E6A5F9|nr:pirin family protein [Gorillibacterium timonense]